MIEDCARDSSEAKMDGVDSDIYQFKYQDIVLISP